MLLKQPKDIPLNLKGSIKSLSEEKANMISHGIGLILYIIITPLLVIHSIKTSNHLYSIGTIIFCISLLMVYFSSTLYHGCYVKKRREKLRIFDHISIYFLIAGTYTPFLLTHFKDKTGYIMLCVMWSMVLVGTIFKLFYTHKYNLVSTIAYVIMGWQAIFIINPIIERFPTTSLIAVTIGGIAYSIGVVFYLWETLKFNHFIWHIFVLIGSTAHLVGVYYCI